MTDHPDRPPKRGLATDALVGLVWLYRATISPMLAPRCRFWPSCSEYSIEALRRHGAWRGSLLTSGRVLRCNPWHAGGVDPVPATFRPLFSLDLHWRAYREAPASDHPPTDASSR